MGKSRQLSGLATLGQTVDGSNETDLEVEHGVAFPDGSVQTAAYVPPAPPQTFNTSGSYTVPAPYNAVKISACAGGGGGLGGGYWNHASGGAGGGGGSGLNEESFSVSVGDTISFSIGTGGNQGNYGTNNSGMNSNHGGSTTVTVAGSTVTCGGGQSTHTGNGYAYANMPTGGAGGSSSGTQSGGKGGDRGNSYCGGSGGAAVGAAGQAGNELNGPMAGGKSDVSGFGYGGSSQRANLGQTPEANLAGKGGGGGGGSHGGSKYSQSNGGKGADGCVIIQAYREYGMDFYFEVDEKGYAIHGVFTLAEGQAVPDNWRLDGDHAALGHRYDEAQGWLPPIQTIEQVRDQRNFWLGESDWLVTKHLERNNLTTEQYESLLEYRQDLRDFPTIYVPTRFPTLPEAPTWMLAPVEEEPTQEETDRMQSIHAVY